MSKAKFFIPVIVTSIISGIVILPAFILFMRILGGFSGNILIDGMIFLTPLLSAMLLSFVSGLVFAPVVTTNNYPFGVIFLSAAIISIFVVYSYLFIRILFFCEGYSCGTGLEPLMGFVLFCPPTAIIAPLIGLSIAIFYKLGMKVRYYQCDRNQMKRYQQ